MAISSVGCRRAQQITAKVSVARIQSSGSVRGWEGAQGEFEEEKYFGESMKKVDLKFTEAFLLSHMLAHDYLNTLLVISQFLLA